MKSIWKKILIIMMVMFSVSCVSVAHENDSCKTEFDPEVVNCFNQVNKFRTGNEAWYWDSNNTTKTKLIGKLCELTLDKELCKVAQIRAKEINKSFSHTRPNGKKCFSVFDECKINYKACAENIAAGCETGFDTFIQWKEDDDKYSGQGHRRNMLGDYTRIGIAYVYNPDSEYEYYWVMVLAK